MSSSDLASLMLRPRGARSPKWARWKSGWVTGLLGVVGREKLVEERCWDEGRDKGRLLGLSLTRMVARSSHAACFSSFCWPVPRARVPISGRSEGMLVDDWEVFRERGLMCRRWERRRESLSLLAGRLVGGDLDVASFSFSFSFSFEGDDE